MQSVYNSLTSLFNVHAALRTSYHHVHALMNSSNEGKNAHAHAITTTTSAYVPGIRYMNTRAFAKNTKFVSSENLKNKQRVN